MRKIVDILMDRDGMTREEALERIKDVKSELYDAMEGTSCMTPEDVMYEELGLEIDYIFQLI